MYLSTKVCIGSRGPGVNYNPSNLSYETKYKDAQNKTVKSGKITGIPWRPGSPGPVLHCCGQDSVSGWGTKILYAMWRGHK